MLAILKCVCVCVCVCVRACVYCIEDLANYHKFAKVLQPKYPVQY